MSRRFPPITPLRVVAVSLAATLTAAAAITWTLTERTDRPGDTPLVAPAPDREPADPAPAVPDGTGSTGTADPVEPDAPPAPTPSGALQRPGAPGMPGVPAQPGWTPDTTPSPVGPTPAQPPAPGQPLDPGHGPAPGDGSSGECRTGVKLVPTCGVLWGVAAGAHTESRGIKALREFEAKTGRHQAVYHAYHRGTGMVFPTRTEIALAREPYRPRILFLNWKPTGASWAKIAKGDRKTDAYLDRLAGHIKRKFGEEFFFTVHHEAEDDVREKAGSGYTARDYAAMYRHVIRRLRGAGVDNLVSVVVHMAYVPHTSKTWFEDMYPGDDVVDWVGWDTYAYSDPGYGHGDFAELLNRRSRNRPQWPGFYNWAATRHPDKPLMVAEWGVWQSKRNPGHKAEFYRTVGEQIAHFPRVKALVHFDTPRNQDGRDSRVDSTPEALREYRRLGSLPVFQVKLRPNRPYS